MDRIVAPQADIDPDQPAASSAQGRADRADLALIAVERTHMPMVVSDPRQDGNPLVLANHAFLKLTGYPPEEVIGRNCAFLQGPDTSPAAVAEVRAALSERREVTVTLLNYRKDGSRFWNELHISPILDEHGELIYFFASQRDVTQRVIDQKVKDAEHRLLKEVDHRAKNVLALVQGIVRLTRAEDAETYAEIVQGRVDSLARAHGLLAEGRWGAVPLAEIIRSEIEPFGGRRVRATGPDVEIAPTQVQPMALLLHELLTNAQAHGSHSMEGGHVDITWTGQGSEGDATIFWRERGGPPPPENPTSGFGFRIMDEIVRRQLNGSMTRQWSANGMQVEFTYARHSSARNRGSEDILR